MPEQPALAWPSEAVAGLTPERNDQQGELTFIHLDPEFFMNRFVALGWAGLVLVAACSRPAAKPDRATTQRERDSVLGASQLPGARGVRGALGAQDSAAARNARLDSVANQP